MSAFRTSARRSEAADSKSCCPPPTFSTRSRSRGLFERPRKNSKPTLPYAAGGFRAQALAGYLEPLGIRSDADAISFDVDTSAAARVATDDPGAANARVDIRSVRLAADGETAVSLSEFVVDVGQLSPERVVVDRVSIDGIDVDARRRPDGLVRFAGLLFGGTANANRQRRSRTTGFRRWPSGPSRN